MTFPLTLGPVSFAAPWLLLGVLIVPALLAAYREVRRRRAERRSAATLLTHGPGRSRLAAGLLLAGLTLLGVAAARPHATVSDLRREGTVVLAFDTSTSMIATDLQPTRLDAAKAAAKDFVRQQPPGVTIGVVGFGDSGVILQLPTTSQADVVAAIDRLTPQGGTSLGQGIFTSIKAAAGGRLAVPDSALQGDPEEIDLGYVGSGVVVLLSDGEDTSRLDPIKLAETAALAGLRIDTVGLGAPEGTTIKVDGFTAATKLDEATLSAIAQRTGGRYHAAADAIELHQIYASVELRLTATPAPTEISAAVSAAALLMLVIGAAHSILRTGRVI